MTIKKLTSILILFPAMLASVESMAEPFRIMKLEQREIPKREAGCDFIIGDKFSDDAKPIFVDYEDDKGTNFGRIKINNKIIILKRVSQRFYKIKEISHGKMVWRKGTFMVSADFKLIEYTEGSANWKGKLTVEDGNNKKCFNVFISCSDEM